MHGYAPIQRCAVKVPRMTISFQKEIKEKIHQLTRNRGVSNHFPVIAKIQVLLNTEIALVKSHS